MPSPPLIQLPLPPPGANTNWPWTVSSGAAQQAVPGYGLWPRMSIVTPSFNQGQFIEETIRSVLLQGYPNLEYFVMDGGSTDETARILKKYEPWLAGWVSETDGGQTDAINKGWRRATGEILAYLNSDDWYYPGALFEVARVFKENPDAKWFCGQVDNCSTTTKIVKRHHPRCTSLVQCLGRKNYGFHQPGMFWRRELIESVGMFDQTLQYSFCHDFWVCCLLQKFEPFNVEKPIACFRLHDTSKTCRTLHKFLQQDWIVFKRYAGKLSAAEQKLARRWLREYEADSLIDSVYSLLANKKAGQARRLMVERLSLLAKLKPKKVLPGLLFRTFVTGMPPRWFRI